MKKLITNLNNRLPYLLPSIIWFIVSCALGGLLFLWHWNFELIGWANVTLAAGTFIMALGGMMYISSEGGFDFIIFSLKAFGSLLSKNKDRQTYYDYREQKDRTDKKIYLPIILGSSYMLLISLVLHLIYYLA